MNSNGKLYTPSAADRLLGELSEKGYELICLDEGCCGAGSWACISPRDDWYHFIIREVYLTCWTSAQTIRRYRRFGKDLQAEIDAARARQESETA